MHNRIALVAISNGLGHLRRQLILYKYLVECCEDVTLFCDTSDLSKLTTECDIKASNLVIKVEDLPKNSETGFFEDLRPLFQPFDYVISDNCIEILKARSDTILYASFFWHRSLKMTEAYSDRCEMLITKHNPHIFADRLFRAQYLTDYQNVIEVGLFGSPNCQVEQKKDLLISFGHGEHVSQTFLSVASRALEIAAQSNTQVWIEPRYFSELARKNVRIATYNREMFSNIRVGVVRPGVGTITEMIAARSYALMTYEKYNLEMSSNASVVTSLGFGIDITEGLRLESLLTEQLSSSENGCPDFSTHFTGPMDIYQKIKHLG